MHKCNFDNFCSQTRILSHTQNIMHRIAQITANHKSQELPLANSTNPSRVPILAAMYGHASNPQQITETPRRPRTHYHTLQAIQIGESGREQDAPEKTSSDGGATAAAAASAPEAEAMARDLGSARRKQPGEDAEARAVRRPPQGGVVVVVVAASNCAIGWLRRIKQPKGHTEYHCPNAARLLAPSSPGIGRTSRGSGGRRAPCVADNMDPVSRSGFCLGSGFSHGPPSRHMLWAGRRCCFFQPASGP